MTADELKAERLRLADRAFRAARGAEELQSIDTTPSLMCRETNVLSRTATRLQEHVDRGELRVESFLRILSILLDLQDDAIAERKRQLAQHSRQ